MADMNLTNFVCVCKQVTLEEIEAAIAQGARNLADIQRMTNANTGCGHCADKIKAVIERKVAELEA
jgi:bacterioferritin-associated ferredoxin